MEARRPRYRQDEAAPPERGHPLGNLTHLMSPSAPENAPAHTPRQIPRRYIALGLIVIAIVLLGTIVLVRDNTGAPSTSTVETFTPAPSSLVSTMAQVPPSVFDTVGIDSPANPVTAPHPVGTGNAPLWDATEGDGPPKPVVFFYGAEFAPYAGVQRWPLVLALSRFGTFHQLGVIQSSGTTAFANLSTFTFWQSSYSSKYLVFEPVERYGSLNPTGARYLGLERTDARQAAAVASNGAGANTFALLDVANRWALTGAGFSPTVLAGLTQDQIAGYLATPEAPLTQAVVAEANEISASICSVDGDQPDAVCESRGVLAADALLRITPPH
jgi:Domain of unknown function (DUF929)